MAHTKTALSVSFLLCVAISALSRPASAALHAAHAQYNVPGGGTAEITATFERNAFTGIGQESFHFIEATLVFSSGASLLHDTTHIVNDMFGIVFVDGVPNDLINHNNVEANGKSKLIFASAEAPGYPGHVGIYMSDYGSAMLLEGWWVTNHQATQAHSLVSLSVQAVPLPGALPVLSIAIGALALAGRTRSNRPAAGSALTC